MTAVQQRKRVLYYYIYVHTLLRIINGYITAPFDTELFNIQSEHSQ